MIRTISVAMSTCNGARFVEEQLESILDQSLKPIEVVVCDDASDDGTWELLQRYSEEIRSHITVLRNDRRQGVGKTILRAMAAARGDWIFLSDQDDVWAMDKVAAYASRMDAVPDAVVLCADSWIVDRSLRSVGTTLWRRARFGPAYRRRLERGPAFQQLLRFPCLPGHGLAVRRDVIALAAPIPDEWYPDEWISLLGAALGKVVLIESPKTYYRQHSGQVVGVSRGVELRRDGSQSPDRTTPFERERRRLAALQERLEERIEQPAAATFSAAIGRRRALIESRMRMRSVSPFARWCLVAEQVFRGSYWRSGRGWLAVARDLLGA